MLWKIIKKEMKRLKRLWLNCSATTTSTSEGPYTFQSHAKNFDKGNAGEDDVPYVISFAGRFAVPSRDVHESSAS